MEVFFYSTKRGVMVASNNATPELTDESPTTYRILSPSATDNIILEEALREFFFLFFSRFSFLMLQVTRRKIKYGRGSTG